MPFVNYIEYWNKFHICDQECVPKTFLWRNLFYTNDIFTSSRSCNVFDKVFGKECITQKKNFLNECADHKSKSRSINKIQKGSEHEKNAFYIRNKY